MKKYIIISVFLGSLFFGLQAQAQTSEDLQKRIESLLITISSLQSQIDQSKSEVVKKTDQASPHESVPGYFPTFKIKNATPKDLPKEIKPENKNGPDLVVKDIYTDLNYLSGDYVNKYPTLNALVCNQGKVATADPSKIKPTGYFYVQFMFENGISNYGSNWDAQGREIWPNRRIEAGECFEVRSYVPYGFGIAEGMQKVVVTADKHDEPNYDNEIVESNESNNSLTKLLDLKIKKPTGPNPADGYSIVLNSPESGQNWKVGKSYTIEWQTKGDVGERQVNIVDAGDYSNKTLKVLGNTKGDSLKYRVPSNFASGKYMIIVCGNNFCPAIGGSSSAIITIGKGLSQ